MQVQLWERGKLQDTQVAHFYVAVPGLAGTPHIDPQPKPYNWTSPVAVPQQKVVQAAALLAAGGVPNTPMAASTPFSPGVNAGERTVHGSTALYPSGTWFIRCGWVPVGGLGNGEAAIKGGDARVDIMIQASGNGAAASVSGKHMQFNNPLAAVDAAEGMNKTRNPPSTNGKSSSGNVGANNSMFSNPLAVKGPTDDVEVGHGLMPPTPHLTTERQLTRAAMGSKVSATWLRFHHW